MGFNYSFKKTRGIFMTVGLVVPITGRAPEGCVAAYTNEQTRTVTGTDGHIVHVDTDDDESGSVVVNLQMTSLSNAFLFQLKQLEQTTGSAMKGVLTLTDLGGTNTLVTLTEALLSSQAGITFASGVTGRAWTFTGRLSIASYGAVAVPYGPQNTVPPI